MRVAMVTAFPEDPRAPRGGVEAVSVNLARSLAALPDVELHVLTTDPGRSAATEQLGEAFVVHRLPSRGRRVLLDALGSGRKQICECLSVLNPDVVHAHDVYGLCVKGLGVPRVFTIHGFIHGDTQVSGSRFAWLRSQAWKYIETSGWADQPHIISISPYVRERLSGVARGIVHDIDNPIAERFFDIERREQPGTIFSAAVISPRKNTLRLVEALGRLVCDGIDARLRLAGPVVDQTYGRRVEDAIRERRLQDRVTLLGCVSSAEIAEELGRASVFALVSLEENSPMGIEEAMAARLPVVTSNRCGMPYMVADGRSGYLVDPHDVDDIAWRLGSLLASDTLRHDMGARGRLIAADRFHPQEVARRTHDVYVRALHARSGGLCHV